MAFLQHIISPVRAATANLLLSFLPCNCSRLKPSYLSRQSSPHFTTHYRQHTWRQSGIRGFYTAAARPDLAGQECLLECTSDAKILPRRFKRAYPRITHSETYCPRRVAWLESHSNSPNAHWKHFKNTRWAKTIPFNHVNTVFDVLEVNHERGLFSL